MSLKLVVWLVGILILCSCAFLFSGKYIYESVAHVSHDCWGSGSNQPEGFYTHFWNIRTKHDLSEWWFEDYQEVQLTPQHETSKSVLGSRIMGRNPPGSSSSTDLELVRITIRFCYRQG